MPISFPLPLPGLPAPPSVGTACLPVGRGPEGGAGQKAISRDAPVKDTNYAESGRDTGENLIPACRQAGRIPLIANHLIPIQIHLTGHKRGLTAPLSIK